MLDLWRREEAVYLNDGISFPLLKEAKHAAFLMLMTPH